MITLSIFRRILVGYLAIMFLSLGILAYAIIQLADLAHTAHTALDEDHRMIAYQEILTDAFLSEARYGAKYVIAHTAALHDQYRQFKSDFQHYAAKLQSLAPTAKIQDRVSRVQEFHSRYGQLLGREADYIKAKQPYASSRYLNERDKTMESVLNELEVLKGQLQTHLRGKLQIIETSAARTRKLAILASFILLATGIALSLRISKSITMPLLQLTRQLLSNSAAASAAAIDFRAVPEIHELATALSHEREQLQSAAEHNARFARNVSENLETPLISLRDRLSYLKQNLAAKLSNEQQDAVAVLLLEAQRLIDRFQAIRPRVNAEFGLPTQLAATAGEHPRLVPPNDRRGFPDEQSDSNNQGSGRPGGSKKRAATQSKERGLAGFERRSYASGRPTPPTESLREIVNRLRRISSPMLECVKNLILRVWTTIFDSLGLPKQRKAKKQ